MSPVTSATSAPATPTAGASTVAPQSGVSPTPPGKRATGVTSDPVGDPNASGAPALKVRAIAGLPAGFDASTLAIGGRSGAVDGITGEYVSRSSARSFVAHGDVTAVEPTDDGFAVDVMLYATSATDRIALLLQVPLLNPHTGDMTYLNLDVLTSGAKPSPFTENITVASGVDPISKAACHVGKRSYAFSLAKINAYLKKMGLGVEVTPGDQLVITGFIEGNGHRVMNGVSNAFAVPQPSQQGSVSAVNLQAAAMQGQAAIKGQDLPLDIAVKLPSLALDESIYIGGLGYVRAGDIIEGEVTTRLESEYKGEVTAAQLEQMTSEAYRLCALSEKAEAGDAKARRTLDQLLGPDVVLSPVKRHWLADDGKPVGERNPDSLTIKRDAKGRPELDPMADQYSDNAKLDVSRACAGIRVRSNTQKEGHAEFKLSGGVIDPETGIRQRVEIGASLKPGATQEQFDGLLRHMSSSPSSKIADSALGHIIREAEKVDLQQALTQDRTAWADVKQIRHKFEMKNTRTKTSAELSLDQVHVVTLRPEHFLNGQPQEVDFCTIETELNHLQINSANVVEQKAAQRKAALVNVREQDEFVAASVKEIQAGTLHLETLKKPQLHSLDHISEGSFRTTVSYKEFEGMQKRLLNVLCQGYTPTPAMQKAAHAARLFGLVFDDDVSLLSGIQKAIERGGFVWSSALHAAFAATIQNTAQKHAIEQSLADGSHREVSSFVRRYANSAALAYDLPRLKDRVRARLADLGYEMDAGAEALFDKLTIQTMTADAFESALSNLQYKADDQLYAEFARAVGLSTPPLAKPDVEKLFATKAWSSVLTNQLEQALIAPAAGAQIVPFLRMAAKHGATIYELRKLIAGLGTDPQASLNELADKTRLHAKTPTLRIDPERAIKNAAASFRTAHLKVDDAMRTFFETVCQTGVPDDVRAWISSLQSNTERNVERYAKTMKIQGPALAYDFDAIDKAFKDALVQRRVVYDAGLAQFVRRTVAVGVRPASLLQAFDGLEGEADLQSALNDQGVWVVGVPFPPVTFDSLEIDKTVRQNLSAQRAVLGDTTAMLKFITDLLAAGVAGNSIESYAASLPARGIRTAASFASIGGFPNLPPLPVDLTALCAVIKTNLGASYSAPIEAYIKSAFPKAQSNPAFCLNDVLNGDKARVISTLSQMSGVKPPAKL
jgi:hypothetical protein